MGENDRLNMIEYRTFEIDVHDGVTLQFNINEEFYEYYAGLGNDLVDCVLFEFPEKACKHLEKLFEEKRGGEWRVDFDSLSDKVGESHYAFYIDRVA